MTARAVARFTAFGFGDGLLSAYARALQTYGKRISADPEARRRAAQLGNPTGRLVDPTLTMHTVHDPLVIVQNEKVFAKRVARHDAGRPATPALYPAAELHVRRAVRRRALQLLHRSVARGSGRVERLGQQR